MKVYVHDKVKALEQIKEQRATGCVVRYQDGREHVVLPTGQIVRKAGKNRALSPRQLRKAVRAARRSHKEAVSSEAQKDAGAKIPDAVFDRAIKEAAGPTASTESSSYAGGNSHFPK